MRNTTPKAAWRSISQEMRRLRLATGLSAATFGNIVGINQGMMGALEHNRAAWGRGRVEAALEKLTGHLESALSETGNSAGRVSRHFNNVVVELSRAEKAQQAAERTSDQTEQARKRSGPATK
jgi:transcriptional regulator with XRE-family HTH domain